MADFADESWWEINENLESWSEIKTIIIEINKLTSLIVLKRSSMEILLQV